MDNYAGKDNEEDIREILNRIIDKIKIHYQPEKIILFGSYAWGNPTKDSDVDLLIVKKLIKNTDKGC